MSEKRPYVTFDSSDVQIVSMEKRGIIGKTWIVRWKKRGDSTTNLIEINSHTVGGSTNGFKFNVRWGD